MNEIDERIERLIVRKLDGELSLEEEHELNKVLIRSTEMRQLLDDYARQDRLVTAVMRDRVGSAAPPELSVVTGGAAEMEPARRRPRAWSTTSVGGLMVACLALFALLMEPAFRSAAGPEHSNARLGGTPVGASLGPGAGGDRFEVLPAYLEWPQVQRETMDRRFIAIRDEKTGRYFVLELRREQTTITLLTGDF